MKMRIKLFIRLATAGSLIAGLTFYSGGVAGADTWTSTGVPEGGAVSALSVDPTDSARLLAAGPNGILLTEDGGEQWSEVLSLPDSNFNAIAFAPNDASIAYASNSLAIYKSTDGGLSWAKASDLNAVRLAVSRLDSDMVYAMSSNEVFKSIDGGTTWNDASQGIAAANDEYLLRAISIDPVNPDTLYLGAINVLNADGQNNVPDEPELYISTDGGAQWTGQFLGTDAGGGITSIAFNPTATIFEDGTRGVDAIFASAATGLLLTSHDQGGTWSATAAQFSITMIAVHPALTYRMYGVNFFSGVFRSDDFGANWAEQNNGLLNFDTTDFAFHATDPDVVYMSTASGGIYKSTDGGETWIAKNAGISNIIVTSVQVNPVDSQTIYVGTFGNGLFKTEDTGATWTRINEGISTGLGNGSNDIFITALAEDALSQDTLYAATNDSNLYKTEDGGTTWLRADSGILHYETGDTFSQYVGTIAIDPQTGSTLYAGTLRGGLYKSVDGGTSWEQIGTGVLDEAVNTVVIDPAATSVLYAGTETKGIFKSTDAGAIWEAMNLGLAAGRVFVLAIDPDDTSVLYAGVEHSVYKSVDGGQTWVDVSLGLFDGLSTFFKIISFAIDPNDSQVILAGTLGGGVYLSTDGGAIWAPINDGLDDAAKSLLSLSYGHGSAASARTQAANSSAPENLSVYTLAFDANQSGLSYAGTGGGQVFSYTRTAQSSDPPPANDPPPARSPNSGGGVFGPLLLIWLLAAMGVRRRRL